ncbi:cytochrome P450 [Novosphingobium colocasiae]
MTGYPQIARALRDDRAFSSDRIRPFIDRKLSGPDTDPKVRAAFDVLANWLVFNDKPKHLRLRKLINQAFMSKAMERLAGRFAELFRNRDRRCARFRRDRSASGRGRAVLGLRHFRNAGGVPPEDRYRFADWHRLFGPIIGASLDDASRYDLLAQGVEELLIYVRTLLARYRETPGDNLLSELIRARDAEEALSEEEILATCTLVLFAGSETTANLICNAIIALIEHPGEMARLRNGEVAAGPAVEEFLRYNGSGKAITRVVREGTDALGGCR